MCDVGKQVMKKTEPCKWYNHIIRRRPCTSFAFFPILPSACTIKR